MRAAAPSSTLLAVPNVTAYPSTASVPITVLLYDGSLLCGFNVAIKGLNHKKVHGIDLLSADCSYIHRRCIISFGRVCDFVMDARSA